MSNKKNNLHNFNRIVFIFCCLFLSILFSFYAIKYIDFKRKGIDEEKPYGALVSCPSGKFYAGGGCRSCPAGNYCTGGTSQPRQCGAGTYSNGGASSCSGCPTGSYCVNGFKSTCPTGSYSQGRAASCSYCQPGYYQNRSGQSSCMPCPSGQYQPSSGQSSCITCNGNVTPDRRQCIPSIYNCSVGYYMGKNGCTECTPGYYCPNGISIIECGDGKTSPKLAKSASQCYKPLNNNCSIASISVSSQRVSFGSDYRVTVKVSGDGCSNEKLFYSASNGTAKTSGSGSNVYNGGTYSFNVSANSKACIDSTAIVTLSNGKSSRSSSVYVVGAWKVKNGEWPVSSYNGYPLSQGDADAKGRNIYFTSKKACSSDSTKECYTTCGYREGCASPPGETPSGGGNPPDTPVKACYKEKSTGKLQWGEYSSNSNYEKVSYSESECVNLTVDDCVESVIVPPTENKKTSCNGNVTFNGTASKSCEVNKNPYYKISCIENLTTQLKPELTDTIKRGLGFNYDIVVTSKRKCTGIFDLNSFKKAYDLIKKNLNRYPSGTADYNTYLNKKKDLEEMVSYYNKWVSSYNLNGVKASLQDVQLNKKVNFIEKENSSNINRGNKKTLKTHQLNISGITNPVNFEYEETLSKQFVLPLAYYNTQTNSISYASCSKCTKLSNQYFISDSQDYVGKNYKYTVNVTGLGYNEKWNVTTNNCSLMVKDNTKIYRPTDLDDPFLKNANPDRETGENWINDTFDFSKIIESDIWSKKPLYEFNITTANVKSIKKNNSELGANAYIGTDCIFSTSKNKYYCEFLRNSKYFQYNYIYSDN